MQSHHIKTNQFKKRFNLNNIYLENNQKIQYIKHSKYRQKKTKKQKNKKTKKK